jgi:hypothetical protein
VERLAKASARGWLLLLCVLLTIWQPASFALVAATQLGTATAADGQRVLFLAARLLVTALGMAAGIALLRGQPTGVPLARAALALAALEAVVRLSSRQGLNVAPPGMRLPAAALVVAYNAVWLVYLSRSRRVKQTYGV